MAVCSQLEIDQMNDHPHLFIFSLYTVVSGVSTSYHWIVVAVRD